MSYRNKIYVCFDADHDAAAYLQMKSWRENDRAPFNIHNAHEINRLEEGPDTVRRKLRERLSGTRILVVLIGEHTQSLYRYIRWEIEYAVEHKLPVIAVNLNDARKLDAKLCPPVLKNELVLHIASGMEVLDFALNEWPDNHASLVKKGETGDYFYKNHVYRKLGL